MMTNVHIVGCPRSGTTLLTEMIATCFHVDASCEHEETIFKVSPAHKGIYLSKKPNDVLWISKIIDRDSALNVIALIRDPRSVVCSIHDGHPGMYFCSYTVWKRAEKAIAMLQNHPRVILVRYEDLVSDPDFVQGLISKRFSFLKKKLAFSEFHIHVRPSDKSKNALGGVRQVEPSRITGWKAHLPRLKQQILRHPGIVDDVRGYGYEQSNDWLALMEGVTAKKYPCRYSDSNNLLKHLEQRIRFHRKIRRYLLAKGLL